MKIKLGVSAVLAFLVFIFITQNTDRVMVDFLLWSREISLVLLVFIVFSSGVIIGWLLSGYLRFARSRKLIKAQAGRKSAPVSVLAGDIKPTSQEDRKLHG